MYEDFNDAAKRTIARAEQYARKMNHSYIGTEHVLLGLLDEESGTVRSIVQRVGIHPEQIRAAVESLALPCDEPVTENSLPRTPRCVRAMKIAAGHAEIMKQPVGPEHLLLGLTQEPEGVAAKAMVNLGIELPRLRREALRMRLMQFQIVERAVRPVTVRTLQKRRMREELLAHLTHLYEEELARRGESEAALHAASARFGDPASLSRQLQSAVTRGQKLRYTLDRIYAWRPGESAARFCLRLALSCIPLVAAAILISFLVLVAAGGWNPSARSAILPFAALLGFVPVVQFGIGLLYFKMRNAMHGAFGSRRSAPLALTMGLGIAALATTAFMTYFRVATQNISRTEACLLPCAAGGIFFAVIFFVQARTRGRDEIADTIWASLELIQS